MLSQKCIAGIKRHHEEYRKKKNSSWYCDDFGTVHIPLSNGQEALIDKEDWSMVACYVWHPKKDKNSLTCYASANSYTKPRRSILLHRLIHPVRKGKEVDHIDRNGLNCRRSNLRDATRVTNMMNVRWKRSKGYKGVRFRCGSYHVRIKIAGHLKEIYGFKTAELAALAYNEMAKREYGDYALLNEIK